MAWQVEYFGLLGGTETIVPHAEERAMTQQHAFSFRYDWTLYPTQEIPRECSCVIVAVDMVSAMELLQQREGGQVVFLEAEAVGPVKYIQHEQA